MSDFSNILNRFIVEKDVSVSSLVKYCGIDRSAMYKIIKGKRNPPSPEIRDRIAHFMHLTPEETRHFNQAYDISVIGKENYLRRKASEKFILNFSPALNNSSTSMSSYTCNSDLKHTSALPQASCIPFSSDSMFHFYIQNILSSEAASQNERIGLMLQPDCSFLFNYLTNLKISGSLFHIEHILCINAAEESTDAHYNLDNLTKLLPLFINGINYQPYYFYDNIHSHYHSLNGFSSMILTSHCAVLCTSDYKNGILHQDPMVVSQLWKLFDSYKRNCHPLFRIPDSVMEEAAMVSSATSGCASLYLIEPEPCLIPFLEEDWIQHHISRNLPELEHLLPYFLSYIRSLKAQLQRAEMHFYFRRKEVENFAETGILTELPPVLSASWVFTVKERIALLEKLVTSAGNVHNHFLKAPLDHAAGHLRLCAGESSMYLQFSNIQSHRSYLFLQEPGITGTLFDYLKSLGAEELYNEEETCDFIRETIKKLKEKSKENPYA